MLDRKSDKYSYYTNGDTLYKISTYDGSTSAKIPLPEDVSFSQATGVHNFTIADSYIAITSETGMIYFFDKELKEIVVKGFILDSTTKTNILLTHKEQYFFANVADLENIAYRWNDQIYAFDQFDWIFNRPDTVLAALGLTPKPMLDAYKSATTKRRRLYQNEDLLDKKAFEINIVNISDIPLSTDKDSILIEFEGKSSTNTLQKYIIKNNGIIVKEIAVDSLKNEISRIEYIPLTMGLNRIGVTLIDSSNISSLNEEVLIDKYGELSQKVYYVGIGINNYESASDLKYAVKDTEDIEVFLPVLFGDSNVNSMLIQNEQFDLNAIQSIKNFLQDSEVDDLIIVHYSGHGLVDEKGRFYLSTSKSNYNNPEQHSVPLDYMEELLGELNALRRVFFIDACHSGLLDADNFTFSGNVSDKRMRVSSNKGVRPLSQGSKRAFQVMQVNL